MSIKQLPLIKLLKQNISIPQLAGYALAALMGMSILFAGFCFSRDIRPLFSSNTNLFKKELMVVNKKVSVFAAFGKSNTAFEQKEIKEIEQQPFVRSLSYFTPSRFHVRAYINPGNQAQGLSTDLFFESVPDQLLDKSNPGWKWDEESRLIPIIIPQDYINLYNFGFAGSQGLPQISEGIMQNVVFKVVLVGNGQQEVFDGRIIDFSDNLNTILVPEAFMKWANNRFGSATDSDNISRLILEVNNPADPLITEFFSAKPDYVVSDNKGDQGKLSYFLSLLIIVVMITGGLIMLPAIGLMLLSINLIIYKNQKTLGNLMLLGYPQSRLSQPYCLLVLGLNLIVGSIGLLIVQLVRSLYIPRLEVLGISNLSSNFGATILFALSFIVVITLFDILWIRRKIGKIDIPAKR